MPELPEVETMKRGLEKKVRQRTFLDVWTDSPKLIHHPSSFSSFRKGLKDRKIEKISRRGKVILFHLLPASILAVHPKMTGHFLYSSGKEWPTPFADDYIHLLFQLDKESLLVWSDLRKFSRLELWPTDDPSTIPFVAVIGTDPLEKAFTLQSFQSLLAKIRKPIKLALLDQSLVSGIGNIYASEILWEAEVHPKKKAFLLSPEEVKRIYQATKEVLQKAVEERGTSIADFRDVENQKGNYTPRLKVYHREGASCLRCQTLIEKIEMGGRSTFFCPSCQTEL